MVYSFGPGGGPENWTFHTGDRIRSSPVIDADNNVYIKSADQYVYSISDKGTERWRFKTATGSTTESALVLAADGQLYLTEHDDGLSEHVYVIRLADGTLIRSTAGQDGSGILPLAGDAPWPVHGKNYSNSGRY